MAKVLGRVSSSEHVVEVAEDRAEVPRGAEAGAQARLQEAHERAGRNPVPGNVGHEAEGPGPHEKGLDEVAAHLARRNRAAVHLAPRRLEVDGRDERDVDLRARAISASARTRRAPSRTMNAMKNV